MVRLIVVGVLLASVSPAAAQPGAGGAPPPPPPPGARVTFVSTTQQRWDVRIDDDAVCTTPCALIVEPLRFVTLHAHDREATKLDVGYLPPGELVVTAEPRHRGLFATGVTFTSLGGMAAVTGITLTAVGCSTDRRTMCHAGLITGGIGLLVTAGSIQMIRRALPKVHVGRASPYVGPGQAGLAGNF